MAASLELRVSTGSQDKERNTSRVLVELYINTNGGTYNQSGDTSGYIAVDGIQIEDLRGRAVYKDTETQLYSGEYEVRHNEDGTKTITVTAAFDVNTNTRWVYAEQRLTLETIKRASVLTIPALTMGEETELTVKKYVESYTHTLEYRFKDLTEKIVEKTGETVLRWTPPLAAFAERVPDKTADSGTMTLITYNENGVEIGRHESAFTAKVPEDVVPSIMRLTVTPVSSNAAADGWGVAVQNKSRLRYKLEAQSMYGATISEYAFSFSGQTLTEKEGETALLNKSGSFEPMATVKDTRGRSAEIKMAEVQVYEYSLPTLSGSYAYRSDGNGNKGDGEYVTAYGKASCSSVGGRNGVTLRIRSRTSGGEWKDDYAAMTSGIERRFSGFEKDKTYEVEIYAVDTIGEQTSVPYIVETERVAFHLKGDTDGGAAFGKYAEKTGVLECVWDAEFSKAVSVGGALSALRAATVGAATVGGDLTLEGSLKNNLHFDKTDPRIHIADGQSGTKLGICAGRENHSWYTDGASLFVYQNDSSNNKGYFTLNTGNIDGQQSTLFGKPNGDMLWGSGWVNPPMVPGQEYPTIERFNGKIVYAKVVDCGKLPAATEKRVAHGISGATRYTMVRVVAGYNGTHFEITKCEGDTVKISGSDVVIKTMWSAGDYHAYAFLKYMKS